MSNSTAREGRRCAFLFLTIFSLLAAPGLSQRMQAQNAADPTQTEIVEGAAPIPAVPDNVAEAQMIDLPDAPQPVVETAAVPTGESTSLPDNLDFVKAAADSMGYGVTPNVAGPVPLNQCPDDKTHARECRVHWRHLIISTSVFNAFQNTGNLYTGYWYRYETVTGKWFDRWFNSVLGWHWGRWSDDNPFLDDYVGHPMMGAITNSLWIQDDPKSMTVEFGNTPEYWHSRMRALAFSTFYSFEWKFGPFGEAGIGHNGDHIIPETNGSLTTETGVVEIVTTPVGGLLWTMAEDALDKHLVRKLEETPRGPFALLAISFLTPARATANIFRFRPPWYRDGRQVKAATFFSDPPGPDDEVAGSQPASSTGNPATSAAAESGSGEAGFVQSARKPEPLPVWPHYGGVHEFGAWWGLSMRSGHIWGYARNVYYMPIDVNYSYLFHASPRWNVRYSPEVTALAMLDEPVPGQTNVQLQRRRTYGGGLSPVGLRTSFYPNSRVQPFLSTNGGFIYFGDRVLSPQGSQFMFTIDFGGGLTLYRTQRQSITLGYRYQHMSNGNISLHNPGTDANTFYLAVSRFRTHGYR